MLRINLCANFILILLGFALCQQAQAYCFDESAAPYGAEGVTPQLLRAIASVESNFRAGAVSHDPDGSEGVGLMQINSLHFPRLARRGITRERLLRDACLNVQVGAEILAQAIRRYGRTWRAVGAYNAHTAWKQQVYVNKVWMALNGGPAWPARKSARRAGGAKLAKW